jgi:hypothetical protein
METPANRRRMSTRLTSVEPEEEAVQQQRVASARRKSTRKAAVAVEEIAPVAEEGAGEPQQRLPTLPSLARVAGTPGAMLRAVRAHSPAPLRRPRLLHRGPGQYTPGLTEGRAAKAPRTTAP